ncbi:TatD family hydrolase [Fodinibius sp. Rm-B-1B1-1]|uniref:TatD family hydrolase n=1 Tax=Fodinibius alkaliphilus TaxID=3140241 RepID=UPI00315A0F69
MIDTHCHLYLDQFSDDLDQVLNRAADEGVSHIFLPAIDLASLPKMDELSHPEISFHKMAGIHPTSVNDGKGTDEETLMELCSRDDFVAVGETGLDYYWDESYKQEQQQSLQMHCRVAKAVQKPIVLHNRDSTADLLDVIEAEQDGSLSGVWHSFTGTADEGKRAIDLGLKLGVGGIFTFRNANVDQAVAQLPLEDMIIETDAPYLAPHPKRGKRNEPSFVIHTAARLAEVMNLSIEEVERVTDRNALSLFRMS